MLDDPSDSTSDSFVGRERELTALAKLLNGGGRATPSAFIEGEAGIGKSRLVSEFLERVRQKGIRILQGCCYHVREAGPYFPFLQVLSQLRLGGSSSADLVKSSVSDTLSQRGQRSLSEDVRGRRAQFVRALSDVILRGAVSARTLVCVEDIQWADLGSLLVLNNLLDIRAPGLIIICTARMDEPVDIDIRQLLARVEEKSHRIVLRGLTHAEARELVSNLTHRERITEEELRDLRSFTNGNPMFLRELFLHLRDTGLLERHTLQEAIRRSRTPDRLTRVIDLRLRSLPPRLYRTLSVCSVIGMEFSASLVAQAKAEPEIAVAGDLEGCVAKRILQPVDSLPASRYRFAHPLFAVRLYEMLRASERRRLHRNIADAATSGGACLSVEELARHYALGFGRAGGLKGIEYVEAAAEQAERVLAYETAARFWELALNCTRHRARRKKAELYRRLGWTLWAASNWTQAAQAWSEAVRLFESLQDWRRVSELALALGDLHRWRHELVESERWLQQALRLLPDDSKGRGRALALLGSIRCVRDEPGRALPFLQDAIKAMGTEDWDPLVSYWLSFGFLTSGDPSTAFAIARRGLDEAHRQGTSNAICLLAASLFHYELGQLHVGPARSYARMVEAAADPGDTVGLIYSLICKALLWGYAGKWNKVVRLCERWLAQVRLAGRFQVATARMIWAEAKLALGDGSAAKSEMLRALPDLEQMRPLAGLHLARALLRLNQSEEAASAVRRCPQSVINSPRFAAGRALLGEVVSALNMPDLWRHCYDSLSRETRPVMAVYTPISVQRVLGRLASRLKLWPEAIEHFDTALRQLDEGGARWELAQAYLDCAEMHWARRRRGDVHKAAALELKAGAIFDELGIQHTVPQQALGPFTDGNRFGLTGREMEVLMLVAEGRRNQEIAEALTLSHRTVERHLESIFGKMGVNSRTEAVIQAVRGGLIETRAGAGARGSRQGQTATLTA